MASTLIVMNLKETPFIVYGIMDLQRNLIGAGITDADNVGVTFNRLHEEGLVSYTRQRATVLYRAETLEDAITFRKSTKVPKMPTVYIHLPRFKNPYKKSS